MRTDRPQPAVFIPAAPGASPQRMPAPTQFDAEEPARHVHRARDYGVGYGSSSGYGAALHFIDGHVDPPFRFR